MLERPSGGGETVVMLPRARLGTARLLVVSTGANLRVDFVLRSIGKTIFEPKLQYLKWPLGERNRLAVLGPVCPVLKIHSCSEASGVWKKNVINERHEAFLLFFSFDFFVTSLISDTGLKNKTQ